MLTVAWMAGILQLCRALGPAFAGRDYVRWVLPTPIDRARVLRRNFWLTSTICAALGALGGVVVLIAAMPTGVTLTAGILAPLVGAAAGLALHQLALFGQQRWLTPGRTRNLAGALLVAACVLATIGIRRRTGLELPPPGTVIVATVGVIVLLIYGWSLTQTRNWLRRIPVSRLIPGGDLSAAVSGSAIMLDAELLTIRSDRQLLRQHASFAMRANVGPTLLGFVVRDLTGCVRRWTVVASRLALVPGVWVVGSIFGPSMGAFCCAAVTYVVASTAGSKLRTWLGSSALWRVFPQHPTKITVALLAVPAVAAVGTGLLSAVGGGTKADVGIAVGLAATAAIVRRTYRPPLTMGAMIASPAGPVPVGLMLNVSYGIDLLVVCAAFSVVSNGVSAAICAATCLAWTAYRALPGGIKRPVFRRARDRFLRMGLGTAPRRR
ncbi:DUF6297 family protein [Flexivirga meconopsidis]|uniref:DUF6297 family protein n=1 Tax=Flexivirga meconopsidis TaxID=2977121 RepID=UPI003CC5D331